MISFETHPSVYRHWHLDVSEKLATLTLKVDEAGGIHEGYSLKLNSYDLGVDIELADAVSRIRFEYPNVATVIITSGIAKVFSAGANIFMLAQSAHAFKVNFCKFTNETRLAIEDASKYSGIKFLAALNGITAGGGYELALACDEIVLLDDRSSAVSLPEVPLLGVLPGTGGLTRLTDKRKVRRDLADVFCTVAEGVKGQRALDWNLVDGLIPKTEWESGVAARASALASAMKGGDGKGITITSVTPYKFLILDIDQGHRKATITIHAPEKTEPSSIQEMLKCGAELWAFRVFRELEDAILTLRFNHLDIGLIALKTRGDPTIVMDAERSLLAAFVNGDWFAREVLLHMKRVLKKLDVTSRTIISLIEPDSCFVGCLAELIWASDRSYLLAAANTGIAFADSNFGHLPMGNGLTRLQTRFLGKPEQVELLRKFGSERMDSSKCATLGLVTFVLDEIDYFDEVRVFCEERASLSPDALSGMEANLRFAGPETMETKIFARLSAWQNWIFGRENATGAKGALSNYGKPNRAEFNFTRC